MKWKATKLIKIIHFDDPDSLQDDFKFNGILEVGVEAFRPKKELLPIIILWRLRCYKNDIAEFSCIGEGRYVLSFDFNENPINDLIEFIDLSCENFSVEWNNKIAGTKLEGNELKEKISNETRFNKAYEIQGIARKLHLLA